MVKEKENEFIIQEKNNMENWFNPMDLVEQSTKLPLLTEGKFMVLRTVPPKKTNSVRDGLVMTLALISYMDGDKEVELVSITEGAEGYKVDLPQGKRGILATKYRGPKSYFRFKDETTGADVYLGNNDPKTKINSKCTLEAAEEYMTVKIDGFANLPQDEKDSYIDDYFQNFFTFAFAKDLALPEEDGEQVLPVPGMVTQLYRTYEPPQGDDKWGNITVSKYPLRGQNVPNLSGDYKLMPAEIATAIYQKITEQVDTPFNKDFNLDDDII